MLVYSQESEFKSFIQVLTAQQQWVASTYTQSSLNFYKQRPEDEGKILEDQSFVVVWEGRPVIAFLGAIVKANNHSDLLAYEIPCICYIDSNKIPSKAKRLFLDECEKIVNKINGTIIYRDYIRDGAISLFAKFLLKKGGYAKPYFTQIIDLTKEKATEKASVRKSFKSLINWGLEVLKPTVYNSDNLSWEMMENFRQLHIRESGRETRTVESWKRQFEMVQANEAFVVLGQWNSNLVSAGFFTYNLNHCFYGSSVSRRDLFDKPMFHSLMWTAILHAKKIGCCWFEVGEQLYPSHSQHSPPSKKELGISDFKAGFGGETVCHLLLTIDLSIKE